MLITVVVLTLFSSPLQTSADQHASHQLPGGVLGCGGGNLGCLNLLPSPVCVVALLSNGLGLLILIASFPGRLRLDTSTVLLLLPVDGGFGVPALEVVPLLAYGVLAPLLLFIGYPT